MYTLVQHSGFVVAGKIDFKRAVELRSCSEAESKQVQHAGGLLFETYSEASDAEFSENYPADVHGLLPRIAGRFSNKNVQGQAIYIPSLHKDS